MANEKSLLTIFFFLFFFSTHRKLSVFFPEFIVTVIDE